MMDNVKYKGYKGSKYDTSFMISLFYDLFQKRMKNQQCYMG